MIFQHISGVGDRPYHPPQILSSFTTKLKYQWVLKTLNRYIYIYICFRFLVVETILPIPHNPSFLPMLLSMVYLVPNYLIIYLFYVVFQTVFPVTSY